MKIRTSRESKSFLTNRNVYPTVSYDIVRYLQSEGKTLKEIGILMGGLSESFISRVLHKQRSFTLRHLSTLERTLQKPLPLIIAAATRPDSLPKSLRKAYAAFHKIMIELADTTLSSNA